MRLAFLALLAFASHVAAVHAQTDKEKPRPITRIAVVNVGLIFEKYAKEREADAAWQDVQKAVQAHAAKHEIAMVLGFSDPSDKEKLNLFPNVNRKMNAMDGGGTAPLFAAPHTDITQVVLDRLMMEQPEKREAKVGRSGTDRVAVVNVGQVFNQWKKATKFKAELEELARPFNERAKEIQDRTRNSKDETVRAKANKELEYLATEMRRKLGKLSEDTLVLLYTEIQDAAKTYATRHGIELILGYGDPIAKELLDQFHNINRKELAAERGHVVPLHASRGADISGGIVALLNNRDAGTGENKAPAIRVGTLNFDPVFKECDPGKQLKRGLDQARAPFLKRAGRFEMEIEQSEAALKNADFETTGKAEYQRRIIRAQWDLKALSRQMEHMEGDGQKADVEAAWKEIQACNKGILESQGVALFLAYANPADKQSLGLADSKRKLDAMESGGLSILFMHPILNHSELFADIWRERR